MFSKKISEPSLVSIIIPCWNYGKFVEGAIDSALASTYQNIEIIVVDDGPTDPFTIELLKNLKKPKTKVIFQKNQGLARARNNGIAQAKGEFILPLDADDKIDPTYIEKALYVLKKNPKLGLAYGYVKIFGSEDSLWKTGIYDVCRLTRENIIPSCSLFRKKAWKDVGGYENDRYQYDDWTFWLKLASSGYYGRLIPEVLFFHQKHLGLENMTARLREKHEEYYNKIKKRFPKLFRKKNKDLRFIYKTISLMLHRILPARISKLLFKLKNFLLKYEYNKNFETDFNINAYRIHSEKKNKILVFLPWTIMGGVEKVALDIIKNFTEWEIFVVTTIENEYDYEMDLKFKKNAKNVYHLPNFLRQEDYLPFVEDLIYSQDIKTIFINHCAWAYENIEVIKNKFNNVNVFDLLHNTMEGGYKNWSKKYTKWIDKTIVISQDLKENLIKELNFPKDKIRCILNGIDLDDVFNADKVDVEEIYKKFGFPENKKAIVFIGRLSSEKNPLKFIDIAKIINKQFPNEYFFIMVGGGDLTDIVNKEVSAYFEKNDFFCLGNFSHPEKILAGAHFLINTSVIEGMPLTIIEALAMNVPIIAPSIGAIGEIVKDSYNGYLLNKNPKVADYIDVIKKSREGDNYAKLKRNTRISVEGKYSSKRMALEYEKIFIDKNNL